MPCGGKGKGEASEKYKYDTIRYDFLFFFSRGVNIKANPTYRITAKEETGWDPPPATVSSQDLYSRSLYDVSS